MWEISYNGDDLLQVFNELNIDLGDLNRNVIQAWFDTDCPKTRDLLNWMCSSLTKDNCLTPQEALEWSQMKNPLSGQELENAVVNIAHKHPGIFDYESSRFNNAVLKDELEILEEEKKDCDRELEVNINIGRNLSTAVSNLQTRLNQIQQEKKEIGENCLEAGKNLEESHEKLYKQISLFINNHTLKTDQFLHNFNVDVVESNYQQTISSISELFNDENSIESTSTSENIQNLSDVSKRILKSKMKLFHYEMIKYGLNYVVNSLNNDQFNSIDEEILQDRIDKKQNLKEILFKDIENIVQKEIDNLLLQPKLADAKNTLSIIQSKNQQLEKIEQILDKILMYFIEIQFLYKSNNANIENLEELFRNIWSYINNDLENCNQRIELMENIQENCASFQLNNRPQIIDNIAKILDCDNGNFIEITKQSDSISAQIRKLEKKLFIDQMKSWKDSSKNLLSEIENLKQIVVSGPTCRIEIIPLPLQIIFKQIDSCRKRREDALKLTINDYTKVSRLLADKDGQNRRQLWVHFLENPQKLLVIIEQNH